MAKGTAGKNYWALLLMILAGVVLGGFIGQLSAGVPALRWLNYGQTFGLSNPLVLDLGILVLTFGLTIKITIAGIIGIVLAILISGTARDCAYAPSSSPVPYGRRQGVSAGLFLLC